MISPAPSSLPSQAPKKCSVSPVKADLNYFSIQITKFVIQLTGNTQGDTATKHFAFACYHVRHNIPS